MKEILVTPGKRKKCPDDCRYRNRQAPFCGFCMMEIRKKAKEEKHGDKQIKN